MKVGDAFPKREDTYKNWNLQVNAMNKNSAFSFVKIRDF